MSHPKADDDARQSFQRQINAYEKEDKPIVYIDESGFSKDMPRTHGYAPVGKRCYGTQDWNAKGRTNAIGAIIDNIFVALGLFESNVNADVFLSWTEQTLLPSLPKNCVIVMDNAAFHKRKDILDKIKKAGHILLFLPPYSPDLNPIEHKWAQAKKWRRKLQCSVDQLFQNESIYVT